MSTSRKGSTIGYFPLKSKEDTIHKGAKERLPILETDTGEEMHDRMTGILPFNFANPTGFAPKMRDIMLNMPSSGALSHQRTTDMERPTYPIDDLNKVEAQTLIVVAAKILFEV